MKRRANDRGDVPEGGRFVGPVKPRARETKEYLGQFCYASQGTEYVDPGLCLAFDPDMKIDVLPPYRIPIIDVKPFPLKTHEAIFPIRLDEAKDYLQSRILVVTRPSKAKKHRPPPTTSQEKKMIWLQKLFEEGWYDIKGIEKLVKLPRWKIRLALNTFKATGSAVKPQQSKRKLKQEHGAVITQQLEARTGKGVRVKDLKSELELHFAADGLKVGAETIRRYIRRTGWSYKKVTPLLDRRNTKETRDSRKEVVRTMIGFINSEAEIFYIDETGFNLNITPRKGWGKKGKSLGVSAPCKSENYSLLMVFSKNGICGYQVFRGGVKGDDFNGFISHLIDKKYFKGTKVQRLLFLDNASIHKNTTVKNEIATRVCFIYNAPYSPMLNPIEELFSQIKRHVSKSMPRTEAELLQSIFNAVKDVTKDQCIRYILHSLNFYMPSLKLEEIK